MCGPAERSSELDRREFCRFPRVCALVACTGALAGCARALEWSEAQPHGRHAPVRRCAPRPRSDRDAGARKRDATGSAARRSPSTFPDLLSLGDDPAANTRAAIALLGGMSRFVKRGRRRRRSSPTSSPPASRSTRATTNPAVVAALVRLAGRRARSRSPCSTGPPRRRGRPTRSPASQNAVNDADGRMKVLTDRDFERIEIPDGRVLTEWPLLVDVFDADVVINVPCAKTHGLARAHDVDEEPHGRHGRHARADPPGASTRRSST